MMVKSRSYYCICLNSLYSVAFEMPRSFAIRERGALSARSLTNMFLSIITCGLPMFLPDSLALFIPSLVRWTNISRSLSATHVRIPIINFLTLGSVLCRKVSLGEQEISGAYSSIAFIASRVSQKVLPTLERLVH